MRSSTPSRAFAVRDGGTFRSAVDDVDATVIDVLSRDARSANTEVAARAGVAASTAHGRIRSLENRGIVSGYHWSINQAALGRGLHAMVGVTLRPGARDASITGFAAEVRVFPEVIQLIFLGGSDDFLIHVAVADSSALRAFVVERLSSAAQRGVHAHKRDFAYQQSAVAAAFE